MVIIVSPDVYEALKGKRRSPKIVSRDGWPPSHYSLSGIDRTVRGK